ncbi:MAG: hypothetical protein HQ580_00245 [Planctomycetes bacterium]|nr:hypothetical protein [Planctomycetota bacterium]
MKTWKLIVALILVIAAIYIIPRSGKSTDIEQRGKELSITVGKHRLTAAIIGHQITNSFLIVGGSTGDLFFTASLAGIPLDIAERLARTYNDFRKCNSQGAYEARKSVKSMLLYAADHDVERKLRSIDKLTLANKDPVIQMTFVELHITNHTVRGEETPIVFSSDIRPFLVKDVQIIEEDRIY